MVLRRELASDPSGGPVKTQPQFRVRRAGGGPEHMHFNRLPGHGRAARPQNTLRVAAVPKNAGLDLGHPGPVSWLHNLLAP